jgi:indolepyruvate ferredoxin oxidoreductase
MMRGFRVLSALRFLRATPLDPFARAEERRAERALIAQYEADIATLLSGLTDAKLAQAVEIASLPDAIRGYGHVKEKAMRLAAERRGRLLEAWARPSLAMAAE